MQHTSALESHNSLHQTKDPYYVKNFLGHKSMQSTEIYIDIKLTVFEPTSDEFKVKVVQKPDKIKHCLKLGSIRMPKSD